MYHPTLGVRVMKKKKKSRTSVYQSVVCPRREDREEEKGQEKWEGRLKVLVVGSQFPPSSMPELDPPP